MLATDGALYDNRTERATVSVTISDVNDNAPVFKEIPYIATVTGEARKPVIQVRSLAMRSRKNLLNYEH